MIEQMTVVSAEPGSAERLIQAMEREDTKTCSVCRATRCYVIIYVIIISLFGLAKIVFGVYYRDGCNVEPMIPIYLIISGCTPLFCLVYKLRDIPIGSTDVTVGMLAALFAVTFNFSLLICGSIWIYPVFGDLTNFKSLNVLCTPEVQLECTDCDHLLLQFAALAVTADWLVMLLGLVGYCLILLLDVKKMESPRYMSSHPNVHSIVASREYLRHV